MIVDIRGGLGTQLLEAMGAFARAIEDGRRIERLEINCLPGDAAHNRVDWIAAVFGGRIPTRTRQGAAKLNIWQRGRFELLIKHLDAVRAIMCMPPVVRSNGSLLHVRLGDRAPAAAARYLDLARRDRIVGDDPACCRVVAGMMGAAYDEADALADWQHAFAGLDVTGPPSSFTLSALFLDPVKRLRVIRAADGPRPPPDTVYELIEFLRPHFRGLEWC